MTDARSILADFVRRRAIPCPTDDDPDAIYFDNGQARAAMEALAAAGFRIIGKDEVDQVTVDRCIETVRRNAPDDTGEWNVYREWALHCIPHLRAVGRKA